jgi:hypothetical protein
MRKLFSCVLAAFLLLGAVSFALAEEVKDLDMTLDFSFGQRTGTYTGEVKDGLPDGQGTFSNIEDGQVTWFHEGAWVAGHMEGQGKRTWVQDPVQSQQGAYSNDLLNGEGSATYNGVVFRSGTFKDGMFVYGDAYTDTGAKYFTGDFVDGMMVESAEARAKRIEAFLADAQPLDPGTAWLFYNSLVGGSAYFYGTVANAWEYEQPDFQAFGVNFEGDENEWINVYGYLSEGEKKMAEGEKNVMVLGVLLPKYEWTDDSGALQQRFNFQAVAVERLGFSPKALKNGSKGEEVKLLQTRLTELGYYSGKVDGSYGKGTAACVSAFQKDFGLTVDGVASLRTLYALYIQTQNITT